MSPKWRIITIVECANPKLINISGTEIYHDIIDKVIQSLISLVSHPSLTDFFAVANYLAVRVADGYVANRES